MSERIESRVVFKKETVGTQNLARRRLNPKLADFVSRAEAIVKRYGHSDYDPTKESGKREQEHLS